VKVVCAWCERDGQPGDLGECEPSENPATTHGICSSHREQVLEGQDVIVAWLNATYRAL